MPLPKGGGYFFVSYSGLRRRRGGAPAPCVSAMGVERERSSNKRVRPQVDVTSVMLQFAYYCDRVLIVNLLKGKSNMCQCEDRPCCGHDAEDRADDAYRAERAYYGDFDTADSMWEADSDESYDESYDEDAGFEEALFGDC